MLSPTSTNLSVTQAPAEAVQSNEALSEKGHKFWLFFASMCTCLFLSALEASSVSTALPVVANALHASQFTWVGSAYALASTAFLPMSGGLAQTFGRRPALLLAICLFAVGSGICGSANSMNMLIAGRTVQGLGGGGIQSLTGIILADIATLQERGIYSGLYGVVWCLATSVGPVVGGSLATQGQWRWIFYLNLPICLIGFVRIDWIGNFLVISSTTVYTIGLTWGGVISPWGSTTVLVPLVLGLVGLGIFVAYEAILARDPLVPFSIMTNLTSISGYVQTFCFTVIALTVVYYYPVYFQACKGASPVTSGVYSLAFASLAPAALAAGLSVRVTRRYRPQMWIGWVLTIIPLGLMSTNTATDALERPVGYLFLLGCGIGLLGATPMYPIQAPLPITQNAPALAFMWFLRSFATVWGITIGGTVLQNELAKRLPVSFIRCVPQGTAIMYALIPELSILPLQTRFEAQVAFADSLAVLWQVLAAIGGAGLVASLFMRGLPLHDLLHENGTLKKGREDQSI